jgi:hypothetical protein
MNISRKIGRVRRQRITPRRRPLTGKKTNPKIVKANNHFAEPKWLGERLAVVREVVDTVALNAVAAVALRVSVAGTEQVAPMGAPVHVRVVAPLTPLPPMVSE